MSARVKSLVKNLTLAGASLFVFVALVEVVLRFCGYGNVEIYQADPKLYWKLKPNQNCYTKIDHKPVHINSLGTRGPEFSPTKPTNTLRIVSLGDSRTFGWGLTEAESYSGLLEKQLQDQFGGRKKVEMINAGVNAWSFPQMLVYFRDVAMQYDPDAVIIAEANLWTQFSEKNSPEFVKKFMTRVRLKNFLRRFALYHYVVEVKLKEVYERYRTKFIPVDPNQDALFKEQQQSDPDTVFRDAIQKLCEIAVTNNVKPVLLFLPTVDELQKPDDARILKAKKLISEKLRIPLVNMAPDLVSRGKSLYLEGDPVHLNAEGNQIIARKLFEAVKNQLAP